MGRGVRYEHLPLFRFFLPFPPLDCLSPLFSISAFRLPFTLFSISGLGLSFTLFPISAFGLSSKSFSHFRLLTAFHLFFPFPLFGCLSPFFPISARRLLEIHLFFPFKMRICIIQCAGAPQFSDACTYISRSADQAGVLWQRRRRGRRTSRYGQQDLGAQPRPSCFRDGLPPPTKKKSIEKNNLHQSMSKNIPRWTSVQTTQHSNHQE